MLPLVVQQRFIRVKEECPSRKSTNACWSAVAGLGPDLPRALKWGKVESQGEIDGRSVCSILVLHVCWMNELVTLWIVDLIMAPRFLISLAFFKSYALPVVGTTKESDFRS